MSSAASTALHLAPPRCEEPLAHPLHSPTIVHGSVPGRARWRVPGLCANAALQAALQASLAEMPGILAATASVDTGTLLTLFDTGLSRSRVRDRITAILRGDAPGTGEGHPDDHQDDRPDWHARPAAAAVAALDASASRGLTAAAAAARLDEHGANALPVPPSRSGLATFVGQFRNLPVGLLIAAGAFSLATGGVVEAAAILAVVGFNGVLGAAIEARSERTIHSLSVAGHEPAHVVRDGAALEVAQEAVVPGDLVSLLPGTIVPADARILSARDLRVGEAMLTGESLPVAKRAGPVRRSAALAERASMVYRGTAITGGSGTAIVVATGTRTEMGRIQRLVGDAAAPETPMQRQLDHLGRQLVWASLAACGLVMGLGALRGVALLQVVRSGISLAVAAIPEGLPMVATTTLALGIEDMRRRGVLVRRLDAVESLASVGVVCFDKTGTLTMNQMRVAALATGGRRFHTAEDGALLDDDGRRASLRPAAADLAPPDSAPSDSAPSDSAPSDSVPPAPLVSAPSVPLASAPSASATPGLDDGADDPLAWLLRVGVLCSDSGLEQEDGRLVPTGSATEGALVRLALDAGLDVAALRAAHPRLAVRHRAEGYRFMATVHRQPASDDILLAVKGSPMEVLDLCVWELHGGTRRALTAKRREAIVRANDAMAGEALRVLGLAFGRALPETVLAAPAGRDPASPHPALAEAAPETGAAPGQAGAGDAGDKEAFPVAGLTWAGLAGMADPVRPRMAALMRTLHGAGVRTVMMTGDQVATAEAVARQLGLSNGAPAVVLDTADIEHLSAPELAAAVRRAHVFARVSPAQKLLLVRALQASGERVAMTGDGINDSPALKAADVGVAMGGAASSEAAREIADVVLRTDDLAALAVAIERGRTTSTNVAKSVRYLLATNFSEIVVVAGATALGFGEPLTAMQLLWINLVGDVLPALGLAFEPPEPNLMLRPPNDPASGIVGRRDLGRLGLEGGLIAAGSLAALGWGTLRHGAGPQARTMAFGSLVTAQLLHALTARSDRHGPFTRAPGTLRPNRPLVGLLLASVGLQALGLLVPGVRGVLGVVPLAPLDLAATAVAGVLPYVANEAVKAARGPAGP